jgi:hypothetical protein
MDAMRQMYKKADYADIAHTVMPNLFQDDETMIDSTQYHPIPRLNDTPFTLTHE